MDINDIAPNILREIGDITKRIITGNYRYSDIKLLYIDIREVAQTGSLTREIGDFVAHNERERGIVFSRIKCYYNELNSSANTISDRSPYSEVEIVGDLVKTLLEIMPEKSVHINRVIDHRQGIFMCILCVLQGAVFVVNGSRITLSWNNSPNGKWALWADFSMEGFDSNLRTYSKIAFESSLEPSEINKLQEPPYDCYEADSVVNVHMMW